VLKCAHYICNYQTPPQSKKSPIRRKFAQSVHPANGVSQISSATIENISKNGHNNNVYKQQQCNVPMYTLNLTLRWDLILAINIAMHIYLKPYTKAGLQPTIFSFGG
jgi:hypothetical protein